MTQETDLNQEPAEEEVKDAPAGQPDDAGAGEAAFEAGDAELERAVRAGLSIADARSFKDRGAFERVCAALEKKAEDNLPDSGKGAEADTFAFDVPELTDDEEFDPKLIKLGAVVKQMGDALKSLKEENASLRERIGKSGAAPGRKDDGAKAAALEKRKSLRLAQPGGPSGRKVEKTEDDVLAEVAGEIASKFDI